MGSVGKIRRRRRGAGVKTNSSAKAAPSTLGQAPAIFTAAYIAEMSGELRLMAREADLAFLSHLLAMAQAEAELVAESGD